jgi:hypothetical protein
LSSANSNGNTPIAVADLACPWTYPDLDTALRGMLCQIQHIVRAALLEMKLAASARNEVLILFFCAPDCLSVESYSI